MLARQGVGLGGALRLPDEPARVGQQLVDAAQLGGLHLAVLGRLGGPGEELAGLAVGELRECPLARQDGVPPGPFLSPGVEEVERQELALCLGLGRGSFDRQPDLVVQRLALPEGQPFVGDVAHQRVAEPEPPLALSHQELTEPLEGTARDPRIVLVEEGVERGLVDHQAEHRGVPEHRPVRRIQPVDLAGDQTLDRLGELLQRP